MTRNWWQVAFDAASLTTFFVLVLSWLLRLDAPASSWWIIVVGIGVAHVLADFASGIVHWIWDTWGSPDWPVIGRMFVRPFREHHEKPLEITKHDFLELNGASSFATLPLLAAGYEIAGTEGSSALFGSMVLGWTSVMILLTNLCHRWAHDETDRPGKVVRALQRWGILLSHAAHDVHHQPPHTRAYCITHGWLNPILDGIRFFPVLEWAVTLLTRAQPRAVPAPIGKIDPS